MQVSLNQNNLINNHMNDEPRRLDFKKNGGKVVLIKIQLQQKLAFKMASLVFYFFFYRFGFSSFGLLVIP